VSQFHESKRLFEEGVNSWNLCESYRLDVFLIPLSKSQFRVIHGKISTDIVCKSQTHVIVRSDDANRPGCCFIEEEIEIPKILTKIFLHGPVGMMDNFKMAISKFEKLDMLDLFCTLDILTPSLMHGEYPPQLVFSESLSDPESEQVLRNYYKRFICFPISPRHLSTFAENLSCMQTDPSRVQFISLLKAQLDVFDTLVSLPKSAVVFQLNSTRALYVAKRGCDGWILFTIDFMKLQLRETAPRLRTHPYFDLFEVLETKHLNVGLHFGGEHLSAAHPLRLCTWQGEPSQAKIDESKLSNLLKKHERNNLLGEFFQNFVAEIDSLEPIFSS